MCAFLCPNVLKLVQIVCKRNFHSVMQEINFNICSYQISSKVGRNRVTNYNLFNLNVFSRYNSVSANDKKDNQTANENKLEESTSDMYSSIDYDSITGGDESLLKKLKIIMLEVEVMRQEGYKVPSKLKTSQWKELLLVETRTGRRKFLSFLFVKEVRKSKDLIKKTKKHLEIENKRAEEKAMNESNDHIKYGFQGSTIFLRVYPSKIDNYFNSRLIQAMQFSQNLVVDCSYDRYMTPMEQKNCAKQIMIMFSDNRLHDDPYNLHFCNANPNSKVIKHLEKLIPTVYDPAYPMNITDKNYLDIFPKEKLVYLTPHCRDELTTFNHDDVYIIGAMVDKVNSEPLSLGKAKSQGIRMACLPLDKYLLWQTGTKNLTLNQVLNIMLDIRKTGEWLTALRHVPKRKLSDRRDKISRSPIRNFWLGGNVKQTCNN